MPPSTPNPNPPVDAKTQGKADKPIASQVEVKGDRTKGLKSTILAGPELQGALRGLSSNKRDVTVNMARTRPQVDNQLALYAVVRKTTDRLGFNNYNTFINTVVSLTTDTPTGALADLVTEARNGSKWNQKPFVNSVNGGLSNYSGVRSFNLVKDATELFVQAQCGVWPRTFTGITDTSALGFDATDAADAGERLERDGEFQAADLEQKWSNYLTVVEGGTKDTLPYLYLIAQKLGIVITDDTEQRCLECCKVLEDKLKNPCLMELIWSYWMEQGMVVQAINTLSMRFQNLRTAERDVLSRFDLDPLRPINNLLWGYIQDELNRLTVVRRAYEYDHHYGLKLSGRAVPPQLRTADSRTKFLEAFHNLLRECARYYRAITNTFVVPDTYPAVNSLRELQLILTEGMHNQYGDLPSTARAEMLSQQYLMARPEMLQFIGGRTMVPYAEPWMMYVDAIRQMHGWGDTGIRHFRDLAIYGERILLAVRFGNWAENQDESAAALFMSFFREEVQAYIHAYRAVTGIDLGVMDDVRPVDPQLLLAQPADLISRRAAASRQTSPTRLNGVVSRTNVEANADILGE